jgi:hypothetical protein
MAEKKFKYYTDYQNIILKEYGRNVQKIAEYLLTIEDRDKRSRYAHTLIELMRQLNPNMQNSQDYNQKLWDHLYIMSDFRLDVESEYPMPQKEMLGKKPKHIGYNTNEVRFKHYGHNVELLIERATQLEDEEDREAAMIYIGKLMKSFYAAWNKENIEDEVIWHQMKQMSGGKLVLDLEKVKAGSLFDQQQSKEYRGGAGTRTQHAQQNYTGGRGSSNAGKRSNPMDRRKK